MNLKNEDCKRSVLTIAVGKRVYLEMAISLAESFLLWNKSSGIEFIIVTDKSDIIPVHLREQIIIEDISEQEYEPGFSIKLHLDKFVKTYFTLFIDCDCLVYGNLTSVFEKFKGHSVGVLAKKTSEGINLGFCNNIKQTIIKFKIPYFPLLCGSVYYLEDTYEFHEIFNYARQLKDNYDNYGFGRLNNKENEEPLIAVSIMVFNQSVMDDDGTIKADKLFYEKIKTNVLKGFAKLYNNNRLPLPEYSTLKVSKPLIVHFNAYFSESYVYKADVFRLNWRIKGWPNLVIDFMAYTMYIMPSWFFGKAKTYLRPIYHILFGYRKIKPTKR